MTAILWLFPAGLLALALYPWRPPLGLVGRWIEPIRHIKRKE